MATHGRVAAEDADEDNDCADDQPHGVSTLAPQQL
jgi:hypothetical protein